MKNKNNHYKTIIIIGTILCLLASIYAIYNILLLGPIEPLLRYLLVAFLLFIDFIFMYKVFKKKKIKKKISILILMFIFIFINSIIGIIINTLYSSLDNMNKDTITYTTVLITKKDSKIKNENDLVDKKIGIINDKSSIEGYIISQDIIKEKKLNSKNKLVSYDDYTSMLNDLDKEEIDAMFISSNYKIMFQNIEGYVAITEDTKVILEKKEQKKKDNNDLSNNLIGKNNNLLTKPFTILLMGVDSTDDTLDKNTTANGDSLLLITFNPKTLNATILSIPRDSYVPITCFKGSKENKITHAAWYGESCMIKTIENFTNINIDYYVKINFKGVVSLVNALGGIDVDVPKDLCTDNSDRTGKVCIKKGYQRLFGEEALVLARNRKGLDNGDLDRGKNQQLVIKALMKKTTNIGNITKLTEILNTISRNMDTNFKVEQILSFYNIAKEIMQRSKGNEDNIINMQQLFLQGTGQMIYDEGSKLVLWNYVLNKESIKDTTNEMKLNLGESNAMAIKTFSFSINDEYTKAVIGEGPYDTITSFALLPDFTGDTKEVAQSYAKKNGITIKFIGTTGHVIKQDYPAKKRLDKITGPVTLTLSGNDTNTSKEIDCSLDSNNKNNACKVPDFTKMTKQEATEWVKPLKNVILVFTNINPSNYPNASLNQLVSQDIKANSYLENIKKITIGIINKDNNEDKKDNSLPGKEPTE
ncbi:MAG: LCP family protein [Bacilli bacterium]